MQHEPCGLLSDAEGAGQFVAADAVLALAISHSASSHLSRPMGQSSKMVPTLTENWRLACLVVALPDAARLGEVDIGRCRRWGTSRRHPASGT